MRADRVGRARVRDLTRLADRVTASPHAARATVVAPATGTTFGHLPMSSATDVAVAFDSARAAGRAWARTPVRRRAAVVLAFHDLLLDARDPMLDLIQAETGKARAHAFEEVLDVAIVSRYYARSAPELLAPSRRRGVFPLLTDVIEYTHPHGVVGVIGPWNYPLTVTAGDAIPALLAGNAVVLKPDPQTSFTALFAAELLDRAGLPDGVLQVVTGGRDTGTAVVDRSDFVCFTGSSAAGREVGRRCAERLVGCTLELGGKNAMIVCADADIRRTVRGAVHACFSGTGQLCVSMERMYVSARVYDEFVPAFVSAVAGMRLGPTNDFRSELGSLVSAAQLARVRAHVDEAVSAGAQVLAGGRARPDLGPYFYEPTVLAGVTEAMAVCTEETFGPVVSIYRFDDEDAAVRAANDTPYGLNASVWTTDTARGRALAQRLRVGTVNINDGYAAAWGSVDAPMGGVGDSGLGRRHGAQGLTQYVRAQTVAIERVVGVSPPPGVPRAAWARVLEYAVRGLKKSGWR